MEISGILSETVTQGNNLKGIVLGLGVNLNSDNETLSSIKDKEATALNIELSRDIDKDEFTEKLTSEFFRFYDEFLRKGFVFVRDEYLKRACFLESEISVRVFNDVKSGFVKSINDDGELVLENDKKEFVLTMGDIL